MKALPQQDLSVTHPSGQNEPSIGSNCTVDELKMTRSGNGANSVVADVPADKIRPETSSERSTEISGHRTEHTKMDNQGEQTWPTRFNNSNEGKEKKEQKDKQEKPKTPPVETKPRLDDEAIDNSPFADLDEGEVVEKLLEYMGWDGIRDPGFVEMPLRDKRSLLEVFTEDDEL